MFDVVSVGGATQDVFVRAEGAQVMRLGNLNQQQAWIGFEYGGKLPVETIRFTVGGGATNTAVSFAHLGLEVGCLVKVGRDQGGQEVLKELDRCGVNCDLVLRAEGQTGYSVILTSYEGERTVLAYRGLNRELSESEIDWKRLLDSRALYISSLSGDSHDILLPLMCRAHDAGLQIAWNPGGTQLKQGLEGLAPLLKYCDLLFVNRDEAELLAGMRSTPPKPEHLRTEPAHPVRPAFMYDLEAIFAHLKNDCQGMIVITDGKRGTQAWDGQQLWAMPVFPVQVADVLGAGDAFGSAFTAAWIQGRGVEQALIWGAGNAAGVVTDPGAHNGLQNAQQIDEMCQRYPEVRPCAYAPSW